MARVIAVAMVCYCFCQFVTEIDYYLFVSLCGQSGLTSPDEAVRIGIRMAPWISIAGIGVRHAIDFSSAGLDGLPYQVQASTTGAMAWLAKRNYMYSPNPTPTPRTLTVTTPELSSCLHDLLCWCSLCTVPLSLKIRAVNLFIRWKQPRTPPAGPLSGHNIGILLKNNSLPSWTLERGVAGANTTAAGECPVRNMLASRVPLLLLSLHNS